LHDQGPGFISDKFIKFVTCEMQAYNVTSSVYYPQGNGINESSHQALNKALAAYALTTISGSFEEAIRYSTMAYNATPHSAIGASPHFAIFGCELALPGWQTLDESPDLATKQKNIHAVRMDAAVRQVLLHHKVFCASPDEEPESVKPGDWVRWKLGGYEKSSVAGSAAITSTLKFQPKWSLPAKVVSVRDKVAQLQPLGSVFSTLRRAPIRQLRLLPTRMPSSIAHLNLENIFREKPLKAVSGNAYKYSKTVAVDDIMLDSQRSTHVQGAGPASKVMMGGV
jgi:hypothetical protein